MDSGLVALAVFALVLTVVLLGIGAVGWYGPQVESALHLLNPGKSHSMRDLMGQARKPDEEQDARSLLSRVKITPWLEQWIWQAGLHIRVPELLLMVVVLFGLGEVAGAAMIDEPL